MRDSHRRIHHVLGLPNTTELTEVPSGVYTAVSARYNHTCGVLTDGSIRCWGYNDGGQIDVPADGGR